MSVTAERIIVIRRDNIGDLICTTPLIAALRTRFPRAFLGALVNSYNAPVLANNPHLDAVYAYTKDKHRAAGESRVGALWRRWRLMRQLRNMHFDYAIVAGTPASAHALRLARALRPRHIVAAGVEGVDKPATGVAIDAGHEVERTFALGEPLGVNGAPPALFLAADASERERVMQSLREASVAESNRLLVGIHISARKPSNRWPPERFIEVARRLHQLHDCAVALFWAPGKADDAKHPGDDDKAATIIEATRNLPLVALRTETLPQLIAGLSVCDYVICSDGGAMHIAAGLRKPLVCLFGDSDAMRWGPWGVDHVLLQTPGRNAAEINIERVTDAFAELRRRN